MKPIIAFFGVLISLIAPTSSLACSLASCSPNGGEEMRSSFVVKVTLGTVPLAHVVTWVARFPGSDDRSFSSVTGADGIVHIEHLQPGEYWLASEYLGIGAGGICFHVNSHPSRKAKEAIAYRWGEDAPPTRQIAGKIIDPAPGEGAVYLQNIIHHVVAPIRDADFKLQNPLTGTAYTASSDSDGNFSFGEIASGTYVLHVEGGATPVGHELQPTDFLIRVDGTAVRDKLLLERSGGSTCGGPYIILEWPYKTL